ncbi:MAG: 50S ribosomal protein L25 [Planctomycetota bacterium]
MAQSVVIPVTVRKEKGTRAAKRLRAEGRVPAVIYGHKEEVVQLAVPELDLRNLLRHGAHGLLELNFDGKVESAVIKELQWDVLGLEILHVDFARVSKDERVTIEIPIVLKGSAPGVAEGGVLDQPLHSIEIECPANNIQENVVVSINHLHLGESVFVKDLKFLEGVTTSVDPDQIVIHVVKAAAEEEAEEEAGEQAEPELIRREKSEEESEE